MRAIELHELDDVTGGIGERFIDMEDPPFTKEEWARGGFEWPPMDSPPPEPPPPDEPSPPPDEPRLDEPALPIDDVPPLDDGMGGKLGHRGL